MLQDQFQKWLDALTSRPDIIQSFNQGNESMSVATGKNNSNGVMGSTSQSSFFNGGQLNSPSVSESKPERKPTSASMNERSSYKDVKYSASGLASSLSSMSTDPTRNSFSSSRASVDSKSQDETVNEDIAAFYEARDAMLKKRNMNT
jgi:hypothetical protein